MKKLVTVARDENNSITHDYVGKFGSAEMLLNVLRKVLELSLVVQPVQSSSLQESKISVQNVWDPEINRT